MQRRSAFETLRVLAPEPDATELRRAQARLEALVERDAKVRVLPVGRRPRRTPRRRPLRVAAAVAGVAVTVAVAVSLLPNDRQTSAPAAFVGAMPAAADEAHDCGTHPDDSLRRLLPEQWGAHPQAQPVMVGLPRSDLMGTPSLGTWLPSCTVAPRAVFVDLAGTAGIVVYRGVADPFVGSSGLRSVAVRGATARLKSLDSGVVYLTWSDAAGVRWLAVANGLASADVIAVLDDASLDGTGRVAAPAGFASIPESAPGPEKGTAGYTWSVQYGPGSAESPRPGGGAVETPATDYVLVEARTPTLAPVEVAVATIPGARRVTYDGADAVYVRDLAGGTSLRWSVGDVSYRVDADGAGLAQLEALARDLVHLDGKATPVERG